MTAMPHPYDEGLQQRFVTFRYDGERTLSGVAMRYGDVATIWDDYQERFEPGAFGNVGNADIILNRQHSRAVPLARSRGGGLMLQDTRDSLRISAELAKTSEADDTLELVRSQVLRGFSIEFMVKAYRQDGHLTIVEEAELSAIAVVDRPAYEQARIDQRREAMARKAQTSETAAAEQDEVKLSDEDRTAIRELTAEMRGKSDAEQEEALAKRVVGMVNSRVDAAVKDALAQRDQAKADQEKAEADKADAEQRAADERKQVEQAAAVRAETLIQFRELLPEDLAEVREEDTKALLVRAVGDEIEGAEDLSEDYLRAKAEAILERRQQAARELPGSNQDGSNQDGGTRAGTAGTPAASFPVQEGQPVDILRFKRTRQAAGR